jgi:hypothetical protein
MRSFCKKNNLAIYLNCHAVTEALRKVHKDGPYAGYLMAPNKADTEGGGKFSNRADDFLTIHRHTQHPSDFNITEIHVRKIKETETGGRPTLKDDPVKFKMERGIYGFFEPAYRNSRALIVLGTLWSAVSIVGSRFLLFPHFRRDFFKQGKKRFLIVGSLNEGMRTQKLLDAIGFNAYALGIVSPFELKAASSQFLGNINDLDDICRINQIDDIIFCSKDVTSTQIMYWMSKMGGKCQFRIMQESNASIISSYSKNDPGELFTYRIHLNLADPRFLKQKRIFDIIICFVYLILIPFFILLQRKSISRRMGEWLAVLKGERTWIGYGKETLQDQKQNLPSIPDGILTLSDISYAINKKNPSKEKVLGENIIYARHYTFNADVNKMFQYVFSRIK